MGRALCGGREGVALWVGGKGWKVDMLRKWVVGRRVRAIEGRRARRVDLVMGSMVRVLCGLDVVVGGWEVDGCLVMFNFKLSSTFGGDARANGLRMG